VRYAAHCWLQPDALQRPPTQQAADSQHTLPHFTQPVGQQRFPLPAVAQLPLAH
jgi:hypothetical protein